MDDDDLKPIEVRQRAGYISIPNRGTGDAAHVEMHEGAGRIVQITQIWGTRERDEAPPRVSVNIDQLRSALDAAEKLLNDNNGEVS